MKRIVFIPLQEGYKFIEIRSSSINSFLNPCLYEAKTEEHRIETLRLGTRIHEIVQMTMLIGEDKGHEAADKHIRELSIGGPYQQEKHYRWFLKAAHSYVDLAKDKRCNWIEQERQVLIEYGNYLVSFTGHSDADVDTNHIIDIKSSGALWDEDKANGERQKYYYSRLSNIANGTEEDVLFEYHIYTKQAKPQFQRIEFSIPFALAEGYVKRDIKSYIIGTQNATSIY